MPKAKRDKAYRPKHIHVPVMPDLQEEFMFASHASLATLRLAPTTDAFDQLADFFNVVSVALQDTGGTSVILYSGMRALQDVCDRAESYGQIQIRPLELLPISNAVIECESLVKQLDVMRLHHARIKTLRAARIARAIQSHNKTLELA